MKKQKIKGADFAKEFRDFAIKGNAFNLAVGVIIGAAFQGIINSIVNDLITPLIGIIFKMDFTSLYLPLFNTKTNQTYLSLTDKSYAALKAADLPIFGYGSFLTAIINFLLMAFIVFLLVKFLNKLTNFKPKFIHGREEDDAVPSVKACPFCLSEIPFKATRCPHCTSELDFSDNI